METIFKDALHNTPLDSFLTMGMQYFILAAAAISGWTLHFIAMWVLARFKHRPRAKFLEELLPYIREPTQWLFIWCAMYVSLLFVTLPQRWETRAGHVFDALILISLGWTLMGTAQAISRWLRERYEKQQNGISYRSVSTRLLVFTRVVIFVIWLFTGIAVIMSVPHLRSIGVSLFASAGVAGIVIGMAAGPALSNLIAGIQLALTQPIRIGDHVVIGNVAGIVGSVSGIVEEINSTYVVVQLWDLRRLIVPLNYFIQNQFENWTHTANSSVIGTVKFFVDFATPLEPLRKELERLAHTLGEWDGKICELRVADLAAGKVAELHALVSTRDASRIYFLQCQVREGLMAFIGKAPAKAS